MSLSAHLAYALLWASFGILHSILARSSIQEKTPAQHKHLYRLGYNIFATLHLGLVYLIGPFVLAANTTPFVLPSPLMTLMFGMQILGVLVLFSALLQYDLGLFSGLRQLRDREMKDAIVGDEKLNIEGLSAYMRHPLYTGLFLILWGRADSEFALATAAWASVYIVIGSHFEERKLIRQFGDDYREYRRHVPAFVPWRGRYETK